MSIFSKLMIMIGLIVVYWATFIAVAFIFLTANKYDSNLTTTMVCGFLTFLLLKKFITKACKDIDNN